MKFNSTIKSTMQAQKITGYRMAKDLGVDQGQLSRFLKTNRELSTRNLQRIFDYLKIDINPKGK